MKLITKLSIFIFLGLIVYACCSDDETVASISVQDRAEQYAKDKVIIEEFMDNHYIDDVITIDGKYEAVIKRISDANPLPLGKEKMKNDLRKRSMILKNDDRNYNVFPPSLTGDNVEGYEVFYFNLKEGSVDMNTHLSDYEKTAHVTDSVFVNYKGWNANYTLPSPLPSDYNWEPTVFDKVTAPIWLNLRTVVSGFRQILPFIKAGEYDASLPNSVIPFNNFGSVIIIIPSGLGYFSNSLGANLQPYSNLVFQISNMRIKRADWDNDGIPNIFEYNHANFATPKILDTDNKVIDLYTIHSTLNTDMDNDGIPNFLDQDDDGDNVLTRREVRHNGYIGNPECSLPKWHDLNTGSFINQYVNIPEYLGAKVHLSSFKNNAEGNGSCAP